MRTFQRFFGSFQFFPVILAVVLGVLGSCDSFFSEESPFKSGLGAPIDIERPQVDLTFPPANSFIMGENAILSGTVRDDIAVDYLEMTIKGNLDWVRVPISFSKPGEGTWQTSIDTLPLNGSKDGQIGIILRVRDKSGKYNEPLYEATFTTKNHPTNIEMSIPPIPDWTKLEPFYIVPTGSKIMGLAIDIAKVASGYPQIMLWKEDSSNPDYEPPLEGPASIWQPVGDSAEIGYKEFGLWLIENENDKTVYGTTATPTVSSKNLPVNGFYRYRLKVQDIFGHEAYYPSIDSSVRLSLNTAREKPDLGLFYPQDPNTANPDPEWHTKQYLARKDESPGKEMRRYVDAGVTYQSTEFVFQVQAAHTEGIGSARLTITKDGTADKLVIDTDTTNANTANWDIPAGTDVNGDLTRMIFAKTIDPRNPLNEVPSPSIDTAEGKYRFTVEIASQTFERTERTWDVVIDLTAPQIRLNEIQGAIPHTRTPLENYDYILNGTIQVMSTIMQERSGVRTVPVGAADRQQEFVWVFVPKTSGTPLLETALNAMGIHTDRTGFPIEQPDLTALANIHTPTRLPKNGPYKGYFGYVDVAGRTVNGDSHPPNSFRVETHPVQNSAGFPLVSGFADMDKKDYVLYLFARDNALNTAVYKVGGIDGAPVRIDQESDNPSVHVFSPPLKTLANGKMDFVNPFSTVAAEKASSETQRKALAKGDPAYNAYHLIASSSFTIEFSDDDSVDMTSVRLYIGRYDETTGALPASLTEVNPNFTNTGSSAITSRRQTVQQSLLSGALNLGTSLPDGIYYLSILVKDNSDPKYKFKYSMASPNAPFEAVVKSNPEGQGFWFAVNTKGPAITVEAPKQNDYVKSQPLIEGKITDASGLAYVPWSGTTPAGSSHQPASAKPVHVSPDPANLYTVTDVTDANPVALENATIVAEKKGGTGTWTTIDTKKLRVTKVQWDSTTRLWEYSFKLRADTAETLDLSSVTGAEEIRFTITADDIYDKSSLMSRQVRIDKEPPTVSITAKPLMVTVTTENKGTFGTGVPLPGSNTLGYSFVNGKVSFKASINDFSGIKEEYRDNTAGKLPPASFTGTTDAAVIAREKANITAAAPASPTAKGKPMAKWWILPEGEAPTKNRNVTSTANNAYDFDYPGGQYFETKDYTAIWDTHWRSDFTTGTGPSSTDGTAIPNYATTGDANKRYVLWILAKDNLTHGDENIGAFPLYDLTNGTRITPEDQLIRFYVHQNTDIPRLKVNRPTRTTNVEDATGGLSIPFIVDDDDGFPEYAPANSALKYKLQYWNAAKTPSQDWDVFYGPTSSTSTEFQDFQPLPYALYNNKTQARGTLSIPLDTWNKLTPAAAREGRLLLTITAADGDSTGPGAITKYTEVSVTGTMTYDFLADSKVPKIEFYNRDKLLDAASAKESLPANKAWNKNLLPPLVVRIEEANLETDSAGPAPASEKRYIIYRWDGLPDSTNRQYLYDNGTNFSANPVTRYADTTTTADISDWHIMYTPSDQSSGIDYSGIRGSNPARPAVKDLFGDGTGSLGYGAHTLTVSATDKSGKTSLRTWAFVLDNKPPDINFSTPTVPAGIDNKTNVENSSTTVNSELYKSVIKSNFTNLNDVKNNADLPIISDNNPVLKGSFADEYSAVIPATGAARWSSAKTTFQYRIDVGLTSVAADGLNPTNDASKFSHTDGWVDAPQSWISRSNPKVPLWNIPIGEYVPTGSGLDKPNAGWGSGSWDSAWTGSVEGLYLLDGFHWIELRVTDELGNQRESPRIGFRVDSRPPDLEIYAITPTPWEYPGSSYTNGSSPNYIPSAVQADSKIPGINSTSYPSDYKYAAEFPNGIVYRSNGGSDIVTIKGRVYDANLNKDKTTSRIGPTATAPYYYITKTVTFTEVSGIANCYTWSFSLTDDDFTKLGNDGEKWIRFYAEDMKGWSVEKVWTFIKDTKPPKIEYTNLANSDQTSGGTLKPPTATTLSDNTPRIQGTVTDDLSKLTALTYTIQKFDLGATSNAPNAIYNDVYTSTKWSSNWTGAPTNLASGLPVPAVSASLTSPVQTPLSWTIPLEGTSYPDGLYRIRVTARDSAVAGGTPGTSQGNVSTNDVTSTAAFAFNDKDWRYFFIDRELPQLGLDVPIYKTYIDENDPNNYVLRFYAKPSAPTTADPIRLGYAIDTNGIKKVEGYLKKPDNTNSAVSTAIIRRAQNPADGDPHQSHATDPKYTVFEIDIKIPKSEFNENPTKWPGGSYTLVLTATDYAGRTSEGLEKTFTLDYTVPGLKVNKVTVVTNSGIKENDGAIVNTETPPYAVVYGKTQVDGETFDTESNVKNLWFMIGPTDSSTAPENFTATAINKPALNDSHWRLSGSVTNGITSGTFYVPAAGGSIVNGSNYTHSPGTDYAEVKLYGSYNWHLLIQDAGGGTSVGAGVLTHNSYVDKYTRLVGANYYMPIFFKVEDMAGNVEVYKKGLTIDTTGEKAVVQFLRPTVSSISPGDKVGGVLRVEGSAEDENWVQDVLIRIKDEAGTVVQSWNSTWGDNDFLTRTWDEIELDRYDMDPTLNMNHKDFQTLATANNWGTGYDGKGWMQVRLNGKGPSISWFLDINNKGDLTPAGSNTEQTFTIEAVAWKTGNSAHTLRKSPGAIQSTKVTFVSGIPAFTETVKIASNNVTTTNWDGPESVVYTAGRSKDLGTQKSGRFTYMTEVTSAGAPLAKIEWHDSRQAAYESVNLLNETGFVRAAEVKKEGSAPNIKYTYRIYINIDTEIANDSAPWKGMGTGNSLAGKAAPWTVYLRATDDRASPGVAQFSTTVNVDNFYPLGRFTGNPKAAGTKYSLQGEAWDVGTTQTAGDWPIEKVLVYLTRTSSGVTNLVNLKSKTTQALITSQSVMEGRTNDQNGSANTKLIPTDAQINDGWGVYISKNEFGSDIAPFNGLLEGFIDQTIRVSASNGVAEGNIPVNGKFWSVELDTTKITDGPVDLNYVIYDSVGHKTYYQYTGMVIRNNIPQISSISLGTNFRGIHGTAHEPTGPEEVEFSTNYSNTANFRVQNNYLRVKVAVQAGSGNRGATNPNLHYKLEYISGETEITSSNLSSNPIKFDNVYAIKDVGATADWSALGVVGIPETGKLFVAARDVQSTNASLLGDGKVTAFTRPGGNLSKLTPTSVSTDVVSFLYSGTGSGGFGADDGSHIPDSIPNHADPYKKNAVFLLSVWDYLDTRSLLPAGMSSPVGAASNSGPKDWQSWQLSTYQIFSVTVNNNSTTKPTARLYDISPYPISGTGAGNTVRDSMDAPVDHSGWVNNMNKGGLYNKGSFDVPVLSGHVEPRKITGRTSQNVNLKLNNDESTLFFTTDTLSGEVLLRGRAYDSQRLESISLSIGGSPLTTILKNDNAGVMAAVSPYNAWAKEYIDADGHTVEWAYLWDTSKAFNGGGTDAAVTVSVSAKNYSTNSSLVTSDTVPWNASNQSTAAGYNSIPLERGPYVTKMERTASGAANGRSKQGWLSVLQGDSVRITGYNFPTTGTASVALNTTANYVATPTLNTQGVTFATQGAGGRVFLTFGSGANAVPVINDRSNLPKINPWNEEKEPGTKGSELWDDRHGLHVWKLPSATNVVAEKDAFYSSSGATDPAMTVNPTNGELWASWIYGADQAVRMAQMTSAGNAASSYTTILAASDPSTDTDMVFHNATSGNALIGPTVSYFMRQSYNGNTAQDWSYSAAIIAYDRIAPNHSMSDQSNGKGYIMASNAAHASSGKLDRWANERIAAANGTVYMSYYDQYRKALWFSRTKSMNNNFRTNAYGADRRRMRIDGSKTDIGLGADTTAHDVGQYSAIGVTSDNNLPVIAYYDATDKTVKIAYCTALSSAADTSGNTGTNWTGDSWTIGYALSSTDPYFSGSGQYISMKIDSSNNIHLAFYNSAYTSLVYAVGKKNELGSFKSALVDGSSRVGPWTDISLDAAGNPWITYQDLSRYGSSDGLKVAFLDKNTYKKTAYDPNNLDASGNPLREVTGWEAISAPTNNNVVKDTRLKIEAKASTGWSTANFNGDAVVGYLSNDYFRLAWYTKQPTVINWGR